MEIHGCDIIFDSVLTDDEITAIIRRFWTDAVKEDLAENELAVYKNQKAKEAWDAKGWSEANDLTMILVIRTGNQLSCVIDDNKKNLPIVEQIMRV
jgi:hypothetical protein